MNKSKLKSVKVLKTEVRVKAGFREYRRNVRLLYRRLSMSRQVLSSKIVSKNMIHRFFLAHPITFTMVLLRSLISKVFILKT
jgi:hypothetical protein